MVQLHYTSQVPHRSPWLPRTCHVERHADPLWQLNPAVTLLQSSKHVTWIMTRMEKGALLGLVPLMRTRSELMALTV